MDGGGGAAHRIFEFSPLLVGIIGIFSGAIIILTFHFIVASCNRNRRNRATTRTTNNQSIQRTPSNISAASSTTSMTRLITVYRSGVVSDAKQQQQQQKQLEEGEMECVICLSQIIDGEEVRVMVECGHTFHVPCIDMWLCSHPNCPVCRAQVAAAAGAGAGAGTGVVVHDPQTERHPVVVYVPVSS